MAELRPTFPLQTDRLGLRPYTDADFPALYDIESREEVHRYLYTRPLTPAQTRASLARRAKMTAIDHENNELLLAAELKLTGEVIGHFTLQLASREHNQGEIGYVLHPDHRGHGYATEGAALMLRLGFEELGLHRIVARCDDRHAASARVMERLGMRREAHLRENEFVKGEWVGELIYALLAAERQDRSR